MSALAGSLVAQLARASVEGALFISAVWLLCRAVLRLPAAARSLLWWAASLKLIVGLASIAPLPLPLLPAGMEREGIAPYLAASRPEIRRERQVLGTSHLDVEMHEIGRQQKELGRERGDLGKRLDELGKQQTELDRRRLELFRQEQEANRKAVAELARLVDDAIARGVADDWR